MPRPDKIVPKRTALLTIGRKGIATVSSPNYKETTMQKGSHTKSSFTPGPWKVEEGTDEQNEYVLHIRSQDRLVTWIATLEGYDVYAGPSKTEYRFPEAQFANARLIAAAPELLEVLNHILAWMEDSGREPLLQDEARQAIAKAEGATTQGRDA